MSLATKPVKGPKNGGERLVPTGGLAAPKYYPAEDVPVPKKARKSEQPTKLRPSLVPGTVLIILAGRFRGKRVVLLKALEGGLLLVTGPFKINGVPLRRVNHKYVIATSTRVQLPGSLSLDKFNSAYFARETKKSKKGEADFFQDDKPIKKTVDQGRIADQKSVDSELVKAIKAVPSLKEYLASSFSLSKGDRPHLMQF